MAKMKWNRPNGRGMYYGGGGYYHYGKGSGTDRIFLTVQIVDMEQVQLKSGRKAVIIHVKKGDIIYKIGTSDKSVIKQLSLGTKIDCVAKPIGLDVLILKEIAFI